MQHPFTEEIINIDDSDNNSQTNTQIIPSFLLNKDDILTCLKSVDIKLTELNTSLSFVKDNMLKVFDYYESIHNSNPNESQTKSDLQNDSIEEFAKLLQHINTKDISHRSTNIKIRKISLNEKEDIFYNNNDINNKNNFTKKNNNNKKNKSFNLIAKSNDNNRLIKRSNKQRKHSNTCCELSKVPLAMLLSKKKFREKLPSSKCIVCSKVSKHYVIHLFKFYETLDMHNQICSKCIAHKPQHNPTSKLLKVSMI